MVEISNRMSTVSRAARRLASGSAEGIVLSLTRRASVDVPGVAVRVKWAVARPKKKRDTSKFECQFDVTNFNSCEKSDRYVQNIMHCSSASKDRAVAPWYTSMQFMHPIRIRELPFPMAHS